MPKQYVHIELRGFYDVVSIMAPSVVRQDMSLQKKHWMVTLQEVFYPALAALGIPCKYIKTKYRSYSCWLIYKSTTVLWQLEIMLI